MMDMKSISHMSLQELQTAFVSKAISPVEVVTLMLDQIEATNDKINALYDVQSDQALSQAKQSEQRYVEGTTISPFDGIPVTIKDSVNAIGMTWHHGSAIHGDGTVASTDSPPVVRLKKAGAIILGKGIMPDFGLSASGVSGSHGFVRNPWGGNWNPGGSSAGCAASLAVGVGMMSVGSDIAGSVRLPASHCGLAALKPTQGLIPHSPASTVRSAGPLARQAADLQAWTKLLSGPDDADRFSLSFQEQAHEHISNLKIGTCTDFGFGPNVEPAILDCFGTVQQAMSSLSSHLVEVDKRAGFDAYIPIDNMLKLRGWIEYISADPEYKCETPEQIYDWFKEAEHWTPKEINDIDQGIERAVAYCVELLSNVDILMTPVMPIVNFPANQRGIAPTMPLRHTTFTALFNQSGHPAISICGGFDERGLPIGIQLVGKRMQDDKLLSLATSLERVLNIYGPGQKQWPIIPIEQKLELSNAG